MFEQIFEKQTFRLEPILPPDVSYSIARVYSDQRIRTHALFFDKNEKTKIHEHIMGIRRKEPCRLATTLPPLFLVPIHNV